MRITDSLIERKPLVVLLGPTAVGKSRVAIMLAKALETEVLTADSRQVYRGMDIGMDKPSLEERDSVPHRLIDLVEPDQSFNAGEYRHLAVAEIDRLHRGGRLPLVVGGTGLYIRALIRGLWDGPSADWGYRRSLEENARQYGRDWLHQRLTEVDPALAGRLHPHDAVKIIRGLETHHLLGRPLSELHRQHGFGKSEFTTLLIGLAQDRDSLYRAIDARVDAQLKKGLLAETQQLLAKGYDRQLGSMKGLGYRQMAGYLAGEHSYDEAVRRLKRDTRHFAKRQMTWFRKEPDIHWLPIAENESTDRVVSRALDRVDRFLGECRSATPIAACPNPVMING
ncbi:MAG TPA: tRNA (adenosine(37)-N6)-dimethylallyltransferase MiaA [Nitrospiraceae bacterium]|nr:tRNA (adenosine(37)-N6)-dimethylallyltransferase MiaA [Nitrospiraceae bacterium]